MTDAVEIREARPEEYEAAGEVAVAGYRDFYGDALGSYAEDLRNATGRAKAGTLLVALERDKVVGTVTYVGVSSSPLGRSQAADEASFRMLSVHPTATRRGIGRALTEACIARARAEGKRAVILHADEIMDGARTLYERLGFVRDPSRDWAPDEQTWLVCYTLAL